MNTETIQFYANIFLLSHFHVELGDDDPVRLYPLLAYHPSITQPLIEHVEI